jgi:hypothetical protein
MVVATAANNRLTGANVPFRILGSLARIWAKNATSIDDPNDWIFDDYNLWLKESPAFLMAWIFPRSRLNGPVGSAAGTR